MLDFAHIAEHAHRLGLSARYALVPRKPLAMAQIATDVARVAAGERPLRYMDLAVDYRCNLKCKHCSAEGLVQEGVPTLSPETLRSVVDQATSLGAFHVGITGGEPLVRRDLEAVIRALRPERIVVYVVTNGTLLTAPRARSLYEAGVDIVGISLDSAVSGDHDAVRGQRGVHESAWTAVRNGLGAGLKVVVVSTVTRTSIRSEGLERLLEHTGRMGLMTVLGLACPTGAWAGREDLMLRPEDVGVLSSLMARHRHVRRDFQSNWVEVGCGAAKEKIYVSAYGDVMPCPFMQVGFGNVRQEPLADIRARMLHRPELEGYPATCLVGEDPGFVERLRRSVSDDGSRRCEPSAEG